MKIRNIFAAMAVGAMLCACGSGTKEGQAVELGPEETVAAFYKAVSGGDFGSARTLCDTVAMNIYLSDYQAKWKEIAKADSTVAGIAAALLSSAEISIVETHREGDRRNVRYSIDAGLGNKKEKIATVKKEEGVWKVEKITDVH